MTFEQHPLSAAFPAMADVELEALAEDIKKHGQREPGLLFEGKILDGWHRYLACQKIGMDFWSDGFTGDDPISFVLSKNLHRRHLTASQRASAVVAAHNWRPHGDQKSRSAPGADRTSAEMAKEAEVSERTVRQAKEAERAGLGQEVREGKVSAKTAADVAKLPKGKRERAVKAIKEGHPVQQKKPSRDVARVNGELIEVQGKYADLLEKNAELADTARELEDKLTMFEATEPDAQQKLIADLQKKLQRKDAEITRLNGRISDLNNKCNDLIRQVKIEKKKRG